MELENLNRDKLLLQILCEQYNELNDIFNEHKKKVDKMIDNVNKKNIDLVIYVACYLNSMKK